MVDNLQRLKNKTDALMTPKQVSRLLGVSNKNIYTWINEGVFEGVIRIGSRLYIYESGVKKVLENGVRT